MMRRTTLPSGGRHEQGDERRTWEHKLVAPSPVSGGSRKPSLRRELRFYLHQINPTQQMRDTDADVTDADVERMWKVYADVAPMWDIYAAVTRILLATATVEQIQAAAAHVAAKVCGCHDTHHTHAP
jgi:hypothetical protein